MTSSERQKNSMFLLESKNMKPSYSLGSLSTTILSFSVKKVEFFGIHNRLVFPLLF